MKAMNATLLRSFLLALALTAILLFLLWQVIEGIAPASLQRPVDVLLLPATLLYHVTRPRLTFYTPLSDCPYCNTPFVSGPFWLGVAISMMLYTACGYALLRA